MIIITTTILRIHEMKLLTLFYLVLFGLAQVSVAQNQDAKRLNEMSNAFGLTAEGGVTFGFTDYVTPKINYTGKASFEYYLPSTGSGNLGFRIFGQKGFIAGKDVEVMAGNPSGELHTKIDMYGGGVSYIMSFGEFVYPIISVGVTNLWFYPENNTGGQLPGFVADAYSHHMLAYNFDLGLRWTLSQNMSLNVAGGLVVGSEDYLDDYQTGPNNDLFYTGTVGLTYYFGRASDYDGDGVPNADDACEGTPKGISVDEFGCPVDTDRDGVADYLDKCKDTPAQTKVDANGCPIDSDRDGVSDINDRCENTPYGTKVDGNGCPIDTDGDGVPDYLDKCSNTPAKVSVDKTGCPVDTDGDGVPDTNDKCNNTPKGVQVGADGCPIVKEKEVVVITKPAITEYLVLSGDTNFETNKSTLLPNAYSVLSGVVSTMKENPTFKWEIGGHTDAVGSESSNKKLSRLRAQSVVNYLVSQGVKSSNLSIVGYGESNPIATNETNEGKSMNRRVEIKLLTKINK